jgi:hypothetical protein
MGLGKSISKAVKGVTKAVTNPKTYKNPKTLAGVIAAPFTGGASYALTANELVNTGRGMEAAANEKERAAQEAFIEARDIEERRKQKMASLAERGQKVSGLASLIGGGNDYLG